MARVVNMKTHRGGKDLAAGGTLVRIDRRTKWGNPYRIGTHGDRARVIELYRKELWRRIRSGEISLIELAGLADKVLCCHCHPLPCHGDVLARAAEWAALRLSELPDTAPSAE